MRLSDGRRLAWSEWGRAEGRPVLFCTGAGMSGSLGFGADALARLGLRLIAIDRPGLGRSDPHPTKTLTSWVADTRELLGHLRIEAPLAVGFSQGAPFAIALAGTHLVAAVAVVAGQDQLAHPSLAPLLTPDVARLIAAVQSDPAGLEEQVAGSATHAWLWRIILEMSSDQDRAMYRRAAFRGTYERALQEGFRQGAGGYARDLVNALGPWPVEPEAVDVPVDLWYGAADTSPVHSPDFGATLAARLRFASRMLAPHEGSSILWTRSRDILERLSTF